MKQEHFRIKAVEALKPYVLRLTFGDGEVMTVDLKEIIDCIPALSPLKAPQLFTKARAGEWGLAVEWIPGEIDMAADNLRAEAIEQRGGISHERIWEWMHRNSLTLDAAAEALGISRRMLAYYRSGQKSIPKHIWLACIGWETEKRKAA
jgi:predicted DNA-binding transcriptional regulator AlpA